MEILKISGVTSGTLLGTLLIRHYGMRGSLRIMAAECLIAGFFYLLAHHCAGKIRRNSDNEPDTEQVSQISEEDANKLRAMVQMESNSNHGENNNAGTNAVKVDGTDKV